MPDFVISDSESGLGGIQMNFRPDWTWETAPHPAFDQLLSASPYSNPEFSLRAMRRYINADFVAEYTVVGGRWLVDGRIPVHCPPSTVHRPPPTVAAARRVSDTDLMMPGPEEAGPIYHVGAAAFRELARRKGAGFILKTLPEVDLATLQDDREYAVYLNTDELDVDFVVEHGVRVTYPKISRRESLRRFLTAPQ